MKPVEAWAVVLPDGGIERIELHDAPALIPVDARIARVQITEGWMDFTDEARSGNRILLWVEHANAKYSKDPIGEGWVGVCVGRWSTFNSGGFVWDGMCGTPIKWQPLPAPPKITEIAEAAPVKGGE